jgi:S-adenosylmethionine/arginine decarboxylase-like enzyme
MVTGRRLILDISDIRYEFDLLETVEGIKPLMELIVKTGSFKVVGEIKHQFYPIGATMLYLLEARHPSIHTYPEIWKCSIDLYTCHVLMDFTDILDAVYNFFGGE